MKDEFDAAAAEEAWLAVETHAAKVRAVVITAKSGVVTSPRCRLLKTIDLRATPKGPNLFNPSARSQEIGLWVKRIWLWRSKFHVEEGQIKRGIVVPKELRRVDLTVVKNYS